MLLAAQEQALNTRYRAARITRTTNNQKCRVCNDKGETINHIVSECSGLAQREYKRRHDKVACTLHWSLSKRYGLPCAERWYQHEPQIVAENSEVKITWDVTAQTDRVITARRPDMVVYLKAHNRALIVDVAVPYDTRIIAKEEEKILKYQDLRMELGRIHGMQVQVVPIVVGALGAVSHNLATNLRKIGCEKIHPGQLQKTVLLGTAHILRKVLNT